MDMITLNDLKSLSAEKSTICVSIFLPTHRSGKETEQDPIRFRNLIKKVENQMLKNGMRRLEVENFLKPANDLLIKPGFWKHQSDGLVVYISSKIFKFFRLPISFEELTVVSTNFHLKPLLPFFARDGHFYLLALSQNQIRLLEGTRHTIDEIEIEEVLPSFAEAMQFDSFFKDVQFHTGTSASQGVVSAAMFHGHDPSDDDRKRLLRWLQKLDDELSTLIAGEKSPLILAGVEYLFPIYKEANSFPHIVEEGIPGNPEEMSPIELHEKAWPIIRPIFSKLEEEAQDKYFELKAKDQTSNIIEEIVPAALHGRVDTIFVTVGRQIWGSFLEDDLTVRIHKEHQTGDEDLLNLAAIQTFLNGGTVYAIDPMDMPDESFVAAILRY